MRQSTLTTVLEQLRQTFAVQAARDVTDCELLQRYVADGDQAAFTVLVQRHGPMVLTLCRRILGDVHAAEDAFQATFMVLARRARSLKRRRPLGGWLYAVARRIALKARVRNRARLEREGQASPMSKPDLLDELSWQEVRGILDQEIGRLPVKYQVPIVLCYLEGKSHDQAAREMGWPKNTLTSRLERARELLRQQLVRRGVTLSAMALAMALGQKAAAAPVGVLLTINTVKAACNAAAGKAATGACASATAVRLAKDAVAGMVRIRMMLFLMVSAIGVAVGGAAVAGLVKLAEGRFGRNEDRLQSSYPKIRPDNPVNDGIGLVDADGDPLPRGALARLGKLRFHYEPEVFGNAPTILKFLEDDKILAACSNGGACFWDTNTGKELRRLSDFPRTCTVDFSPDGKRVAINSGDVTVLDVASENQVFKVDRTDWFPIANMPICYSPDGKTLAASYYEGDRDKAMVKILDASTGREKMRLSNVSPFHTLSFSPDSRTLAVGQEESVRVFDVVSGKCIRHIPGEGVPFARVIFSRDSRMLAWQGKDRIVLTETASAQPRATFDFNIDFFGSFAFADDGRNLVSWKRGGAAQVWDLKTGRLCRELTTVPCRSAALSKDGTVAILSNWRTAIGFWDIASGAEKPQEFQAHGTSIRSVNFTPDSKKVITAGFDEDVCIWDAANGKRLDRFKGKGGEAVAISPDARHVAAIMSESAEQASMWDMALGNRTLPLTKASAKTTFISLAFSPNGKQLLSGHLKGPLNLSQVYPQPPSSCVNVWDATTGELLQELDLGMLYPGFIAVAADGKTVAIGGQQRGLVPVERSYLAILDVKAGGKLFSMGQHPGVSSLAMAPDGKILAAGGQDRTVRVFEVATGQERFKLSGHKRAVAAVAFSPDGRVLASADGIGADYRLATGEPFGDSWNPKIAPRILFWDVATGKELYQLGGLSANVTSLAFSPDGTRLVSGLGDGTALVWDVAAIRPSPNR
jgi:RNA polymerase sigma factor (sigma-70 family)